MKLPRWLKISCLVALALLLLVVLGIVGMAWYVKSQMLNSGGVLSPEQAAYDVRHYDLEVSVDPATETIRGSNVATVEVAASLDRFVIDLDDRLEVSSVTVDETPSEFTHRKGRISVPLAASWAPGERHRVKINYAGEPKVALRPPWIDGFVWSETPSGQPWVGVTSQGDGGDNWWPCKDHPSDEPDEGMNITLTVPSDLVGLTNGRKMDEIDNGDGTTTSSWQVHYPINNYGVSLAIAPYLPIEETYHGIDGTLNETIVFWTLPEHEEAARRMWPQAVEILTVLGRRFGEYPFFDDKYWVVDSPYLGMEHQTLVAYGDTFENNEWGFDDLLLHETAHEWWGNKITVSDWADFWIQEGFGTYAEAVYVNDTLGIDAYLDYAAKFQRNTSNRKPVIQGSDLTSAKAYSGDIYVKGAATLHTLRYLLGDDQFFALLYRFANDPAYAYQIVSMEDWTALADEMTGRNLDWFWERYIYTADLPRWSLERSGDKATLSWNDPSFSMPLPVSIDGEVRNLELPNGRVVFDAPAAAAIVIDPKGWVLEASDKDRKAEETEETAESTEQPAG